MLLQLLAFLLSTETFLSKELTVLPCSQENWEQLNCRQHPHSWKGRDSATSQVDQSHRGLRWHLWAWRPHFRSGGPCLLPLSSFAYVEDVTGEGECWLGSQGPGQPSVRRVSNSPFTYLGLIIHSPVKMHFPPRALVSILVMPRWPDTASVA